MRKFQFWTTSKYSVKELFLLLTGKYQKLICLGGSRQPSISLAMLTKRLSLGKDPMEQSKRNLRLRGIKLRIFTFHSPGVTTVYQSDLTQVTSRKDPDTRLGTKLIRHLKNQLLKKKNQLFLQGLKMLEQNNMDWLQLIIPIYYENLQEQWLNVHKICKKNGSVSCIGLNHTEQVT